MQNLKRFSIAFQVRLKPCFCIQSISSLFFRGNSKHNMYKIKLIIIQFALASVRESNRFGCCNFSCADLSCKFKLHLIERGSNQSKKLVRPILLLSLSNIIKKLTLLLKLLQLRIALETIKNHQMLLIEQTLPQTLVFSSR